MLGIGLHSSYSIYTTIHCCFAICINESRHCGEDDGCLDNSILITANMQSETGFPSSHQLKSYVASKSRLKLAVRAVLSADAGLLVAFDVSSEGDIPV